MFRLYYICEQTIRKTEKGEKQYKCSLKNSLEELLIPKLWYLRFPPLDTWSINGFSPLDNVLDL